MSDNARQTQPYAAITTAGTLRITVAAGPCPSGLSFTLSGGEHMIGRNEGDVLLTEDMSVSPLHASVKGTGDTWSLSDAGSTNGIWQKVAGPVALSGGELFRVGRQLFRFEPLAGSQGPVTDDGTHFFASPPRRGTFRVLQILEGGVAGQASTTSGDELTIGVQGTSISFSADNTLSGRHARIVARDGGFFLEDLGSTNGTWLKVNGTTEITGAGGAFFLGDTLLRMDVL